MAARNFSAAMQRVLLHEGGWSNHKKDPGGVTLQGITQRIYDADRARRGLPRRVLLPTLAKDAGWIAERDAIYRSQYWNAVQADKLPAGIDYCVFDAAVNSGPAQAAKWLQRAVGVRDDGRVGEITLAAAARHPDHDYVVADICARRLAMMRTLKGWPSFKGGWTDRVAAVKTTAQAWASGSVGPAPAPISNAGAKAEPSSAKPAPSTAAADAAAGGGIASGTIAGTLQQAQETLAPLAYVSEHLATIVAVLAVTGVVLTIGGLAYGWWARRRAAELSEALA